MARDRYERRHRRTAKHAECAATMAGADFDAFPSLAEAMGLEESKMNPYGKNEEKGPSIPLGLLLNPPPSKRPPCDRCDSGNKTIEEVNGQAGNWTCPDCGRILFGTI